MNEIKINENVTGCENLSASNQKDAKAGIAPLIYVAVAAAAALLSSCQVGEEVNNVCPQKNSDK